MRSLPCHLPDLRHVTLNLAPAQSGLRPEQQLCCGCKSSPCGRSVLDLSLSGSFHPFDIVNFRFWVSRVATPEETLSWPALGHK